MKYFSRISIVISIFSVIAFAQQLSLDTVFSSSLGNIPESKKIISISNRDSANLFLNRIEIDTGMAGPFPSSFGVAILFGWKNRAQNCPENITIGTRNNMFDAYGCQKQIGIGDTIALHSFRIDPCFCILKTNQDIKFGDTINIKVDLYFSNKYEKYGKNVKSFYLKGVYQWTSSVTRRKSTSNIGKAYSPYLINGRFIKYNPIYYGNYLRINTAP